MQSKPPRTLIRNKEIMMMMMMMVMIMIIIIIMAVQSKPPHTLIRNKDLMMTMMMMILMTKMMTIMMTMMKITLKNTLQHIPPRSPCECTSSRLQRARWEKTSYSFKFYFTLSLHYCLNSCFFFVIGKNNTDEQRLEILLLSSPLTLKPVAAKRPIFIHHQDIIGHVIVKQSP